jgi:hypothetical protein
MALTPQGQRLTEANRLRQIRLAAQAAGVALVLWDDLSASDLDASTPAWLAANTALANRFGEQSKDATASYIERYRAAEVGAATGQIVTPIADGLLTSQVLLLAGPVRVKQLIKSGVAGGDALRAARTGFLGMMRREVMQPGRKTIDLTTDQDQAAIGWRRVSDGDPCSFCALLCSRGPVYRSRGYAGADPTQGLRMKFHAHCGCSAEIVYGSWEPNADEQAYVDSYKSAVASVNAAGAKRSPQNILREMRGNGSFRDSPSVRRVAT